ncbi:RraA family protein [Amycolatopsis orientalis]|uniref:RraA family protein n=1 Tax=Amycolatopsis orientalis TaxID=31958 RepID=UPI0003A2BDA5|nr:hypothetical protein [Amycolatopsis orientalis]
MEPSGVGTVPADRVRAVAVPATATEVIERYLALPDMTCAVADALDSLGLDAACRPGLRAVRPGSRVCGPAVTLRYEPAGDPAAAVLGDRDLYGLAPIGAVAVIGTGGHTGHAVVGQISAAWAALAGVAGIVVDGAVRDLDALSGKDVLPVWSLGAAPANARRRLDAAELNGPVRIADVLVLPGDLAVADDNGTVVVPASAVEDVLARCETAEAAEARLRQVLAESADLPALLATLRHHTEGAPPWA